MFLSLSIVLIVAGNLAATSVVVYLSSLTVLDQVAAAQNAQDLVVQNVHFLAATPSVHYQVVAGIVSVGNVLWENTMAQMENKEVKGYLYV